MGGVPEGAINDNYIYFANPVSRDDGFAGIDIANGYNDRGELKWFETSPLPSFIVICWKPLPPVGLGVGID